MFRFPLREATNSNNEKNSEYCSIEKGENFNDDDPRSGQPSASSHAEKTTVHVCDTI
jgi:hypothetical protein